MATVDPLVFAAEMGMAVSFILGFLVRPVGALGVLYVLGLWMGLYRNAAEWPWEYIAIAVVCGQFAVYSAGRSLGLDGFLGRRVTRRRPL